MALTPIRPEPGSRLAATRSLIGRRAPIAAYIATSILAVAAATVQAAEPTRLIVPAYGDPCCGSGRELWSALIDVARPGTIDVILNPNSGPGRSPISQNYIDADGQSGPLLDLSRAGASILGYVHTRWGDRELPQVLGEIDRFFDSAYYRNSDFRLQGIFIDEMSNDLADVDYYRSIRQHVRDKSAGAIVVGNPGTSSVVDSSAGTAGWTVEQYATLYDRLVTFEQNGIVYRNQFARPDWMKQQPASRFAHIIHSETSLDRMLLNVRLAAERNVGTIYITDDVLPNPYDGPPTFWKELVSAVIPPVSIDELTAAVRVSSRNHNYDLNRDGLVDQLDRRHWVESVAGTTWGDANLDGHFNSQDLVEVLATGEYENPLAPEARWATGDWNGDGRVNSADLVLAFQQGGYENAATPLAEPSAAGKWPGLIVVCLAAALRGMRNSCCASK